jgi:hypothetical protein
MHASEVKTVGSLGYVTLKRIYCRIRVGKVIMHMCLEVGAYK